MTAVRRRAHGVGRAPLLLTVTLLLVAVAMLTVPAPAHAVVPRKHARAYRILVSKLLKAKNIDVQSYNALDDAVVDTAQNIIEILGSDPVDHDALLNEEAHAAELADNADALIVEPEALQGNCDAFYAITKKWFSRADRITLRQGFHNVDAGAGHIITAYIALGSACDVLATDPPDVDQARELNGQAIAAVKLANPKFTKGFKQLRSLQR
jgi:hypothetical protein